MYFSYRKILVSKQKRWGEMKVEDDANKKKIIFDWCENHIGLLTAIASILGIGVTGLLRCLFYWYEKGYYDFWGIPINFMEINHFNLLMQFLLSFSGIVIIIAFWVIYIEIYNSFGRKGRIFLNIFPLFFNILLLIYATYKVGGTFYDVFNFGNYEVRKMIIIVELILYPLEFFIIHCFKEKKPKKEIHIKQKFREKIKKKRENINSSVTEQNCNMDDAKKNEEITKIDEEVNKTDQSNKGTIKIEGKKSVPFIKKGTLIFILFIVVYGIGVMRWTCYLLYSDRKDKCEDIKKFEVLKDKEDQEYIILTTFDDKYFVKPCIVSEEQHFVIINSDRYKLIEMDDNEVIIYDFGYYENVLNLLNNEEYMLHSN